MSAGACPAAEQGFGMGERKTWIIKWGAIALGVLAAAVVMGSTHFGRDEAASASPLASAAPAPDATTSLAAETAAPTADEDYSALAEDGFVVLDGFLYAVDANGHIKRNFSDGMLNFDADGRYTSGDAELDALVAELIVAETDPAAPRIDRLHRLYDYIRDNMQYVGYVNNHYSLAEPNGVDGWGNSVAKEALSQLAGNCYYYNSAFAALARGLGYQAYIVTGTCGLPPRTHCWCEIEFNGLVYYCDPELEWSRSVYQQEQADIFFKDWSETEGWCYTPDVERQSEAKETEAQAKYDAMIEYAKAHPSPRVIVTPEPTPASQQPEPTPAPTPAPTTAPAPEAPAPTPEPAPPTVPDAPTVPETPAEPAPPAPVPEPPAPEPAPEAPPADPAPVSESAE